MARTPLKKLPPAWRRRWRRCLRDRDDRVVRQAIASARAAGGSTFDDDAERLGRDRARPPELRVAAWAALCAARPRIGPDDFAFLRAQLRRDKPPLLRLAAAKLSEPAGSTTVNSIGLSAVAGRGRAAGIAALARRLRAVQGPLCRRTPARRTVRSAGAPERVGRDAAPRARRLS